MKRVKRLLRRARRPLTWRVNTRRLFLLALPLALPVWLAYTILLFCAVAVLETVRPIIAFWCEPPRREPSYFGAAPETWSSDLSNGLKVVPIKQSEAA